ncbi:MAG: type II secretion system GspH family protein [Rhodobacteraceae bacterium]|nr:type II secretion system GspH family protein [Paracoccaceae bacterium]
MANTRKSGFTLLEMMISFVILSVAITSLYKALTLGLTSANERLQQYEATEIALSLIAELEVIPPPIFAEGKIGEKWRWEAQTMPAQPTDSLPPSIRFSRLVVDVFLQKENQARVSLSRLGPAEYSP